MASVDRPSRDTIPLNLNLAIGNNLLQRIREEGGDFLLFSDFYQISYL
jgi:hypothetical protein